EANAATVATLCRRLDGVPLALKLAAARVALLGLDGLAARLGDRLKLLAQASRDAPSRQQTLQAALDWSHGLLGPVEQTVFRRLAVFAGSFALEPAVAVAGAGTLDEWRVLDALGELVDRSLLTVDGAGASRYRLLETARDYARLRLDAAGERDLAQQHHADAMAAHMDAAYEAYWITPDRRWLDEYAPDLDNVRSALDWGTAHAPELAVRIAGAGSMLFLLLGRAHEMRGHMQALEHVARGGSSPAASRFWLERSRLHWGVSSVLMRDFALEAADRSRAEGDARGLSMALRCGVRSAALAAAG